jgi:octaheme c-type cytochrome (tetrathionate reductase family)
MKNKLVVFIAIVLIPQIFLAVAILDKPKELDPAIREALIEKVQHRPKKAVDHSKFAELQKDFKEPQEVTEACLSCHTERGKELLTNHHWLWEREAFIEGRGVVYLGKKNLINNFCTGVGGSEGSCNKCHAGYGWDEKEFDFTNERNMDCLVCHDNTNTYEKASGGAGYPPTSGPMAPNYNLIASNVGKPTKHNCGYCHFYSAGGNNIKHGHLEVALLTATKSVDVHMAKEGMDMSCTDCHTTQNHVMQGRYYGTASNDYNRATCTQCHGSTPHAHSKLNEHTVKVACQTCHIPTYAKVNPTKMYWDWSTACDLQDGKPIEYMDSTGTISYQSIKGTAHWAKNVEPDYIWFNGQADHMLVTDSITSFPVQINTLYGSYTDSKAQIWPVKIHRGKQPFDPVLHRVLKAKLWDKEPGKGALWVDFNWEAALREGMKLADLPWSGEWEFVETEMYLPISHMVSPKTEALSCSDCHTREGSRLAGLNDFYMPGRDRSATIDLIGVLLILGTLGGVATHGFVRIFISRKKKKQALQS